MNISLIPINFDQYVEYAGDHPSGMGGVQVRLRFPNNYGASLIHTPFSYGHTERLVELAVIRYTEPNDYHLTYDTPITDDVLVLDKDELVTTLLAIMALPISTQGV